MLTGLSLSFCVRDILRGKVKISDVREIIAGTACKDEEEWNEALLAYRQSYWYENPAEAERIARELIKTGRVRQPRIEGKAPPRIIINGWWKNDQKQIVHL